MRPYKENFDVGHFGTDNPATAIAEPMPFVVEFREDVDLSPYGGPDVGTEGRLRQHRRRRGRARHARRRHHRRQRPVRRRDGRPGARRQGRLHPRLLLGRRLHRGRAHRRHGRPRRQPRRRRRQHVDRRPPGPQRRQQRPGPPLRRAHRRYGVQLVISAGNSGPGINTIGDPSVATDVVSVGSSITKETWLANYGSEVSTPLTLHNYSSRGPREDGGFKPNVMAPGLGDLVRCRPGSRAARSPRPATRCRRATRCSTAPRWPPRRPPAPSRCCCRPRRPRDVEVDPAPAPRLALHLGRLRQGRRGDRPGHRPGRRPRRLGPAQEQLRRRRTTPSPHRSAPRSPDFLATPDQGTGVYNRCDAGPRRPGRRRGQDLRREGRPARQRQGRPRRPQPAARRQRRHVLAAGVEPSAAQGRARSTSRSRRAPALPACTRRSSRSTTRRPRSSTTGCCSRSSSPPTSWRRRSRTSQSGTVERNLTKKLFVTVPRGRQGAAGQPVRHRRQGPDPLDRHQPVRRPGRVDRRRWPCYTNFSAADAATAPRVPTRTRCPGVWEIEVEARRTSPSLVNPYQLTRGGPGRHGRPGHRRRCRGHRPAQPAPVSWTRHQQLRRGRR